MNKTNKAILIVVLLVVVAFGIAQFFVAPVQQPIVPSGTNEGSPSTPSQATQVVSYVPSTPATSTPVEQGSCWTNSIAAPFRADAWRCMVGNGISDPCFAIPGSSELLCGANPANPSATSTFALKLTKPLPKSEPVQGLQPSTQGWIVALADGTLCSPFTGTIPFTATGDMAMYGCAPGNLGKDVMIFGINTSTQPWVAEIGTLAPAPKTSTSGLPVISSSTTIPVATIWQ